MKVFNVIIAILMVFIVLCVITSITYVILKDFGYDILNPPSKEGLNRQDRED